MTLVLKPGQLYQLKSDTAYDWCATPKDKITWLQKGYFNLFYQLDLLKTNVIILILKKSRKEIYFVLLNNKILMLTGESSNTFLLDWERI